MEPFVIDVPDPVLDDLRATEARLNALGSSTTTVDGDHEQVVDRDRLLDNVMLYWLTNTGASSARLYAESYDRPNLDAVSVPTGCSIFPREIIPASRRFIEARFTDLRTYVEHPRGGHFAALEQPAALVDDIRTFARALA